MVAKLEYALECWLSKEVRIDLSQQQYEEIKLAKEALSCAVLIEELQDYILENYKEWEAELINASIEFMVSPDSSLLDSKRRLATRRLINFLTTCRMYREQPKKLLKNCFDSSLSQKIDGYFTQKRSESFYFRFCEELRNYAQHHNFPIHTLKLSVQRRGENKNENLFFNCFAEIDTQSISEYSGFNKDLVVEITKRELINVSVAIREYLAGLSEIHNWLRDEIKPEVESAEKLISNYKNKILKEYSNQNLKLYAGVKDARGSLSEFLNFPDFLIERRNDLIKRNKNLSNLPIRVVTNQNF